MCVCVCVCVCVYARARLRALACVCVFVLSFEMTEHRDWRAKQQLAQLHDLRLSWKI